MQMGLAWMTMVSAATMLVHAFSTALVFVHLHQNVPWQYKVEHDPSRLIKMLAGPAYLTEIQYTE